jgi:hypothetical protein
MAQAGIGSGHRAQSVGIGITPVYNQSSPGGETGRRKGLKIPFSVRRVWVQVPPRAPNILLLTDSLLFFRITECAQNCAQARRFRLPQVNFYLLCSLLNRVLRRYCSDRRPNTFCAQRSASPLSRGRRRAPYSAQPYVEDREKGFWAPLLHRRRLSSQGQKT